MKKKNQKLVKGFAALVLVLAAILAVTMAIEKISKDRDNKHGGDSDDDSYGYDNVLWIGDDVYGYNNRIETFLFIGTDASGNEEGTGEDYRGTMADVLLLMVIDHTNDTYGLLQIDRNTITNVNVTIADGEDKGGLDEQICTAHWYGANPEESAENTVEAVKGLVGDLDDIDGYYVLNMDQIGQLNAAVGGVEVTIEDDMTSIDPAFQKGTTITLSDEQAEEFVRARMALEDDTNASRMRRQRAFMKGFSDKATRKLKEDPNFANDLWDTFEDVAVTDMSGKDISKMAEAVRSNESKGTLTFQGETKIGHVLKDGLEHEEFYPDQDSVVEVLTELFSLEKVEGEEDD